MLTTINAGRSPETATSFGAQSARLPDPAHRSLASDRWPGAFPPPRGEYDMRPARTAYEHGMAGMLVRRMYAWRGYHTEAVGQPADDPNRLTLAAWRDDEVVATLTLGRDSPVGLLADALYSPELNRLRHPQRVVCEVSSLAVAPDFSSSDLLITLLQFAHQQGKALFAATDVVIEVNPRHAGYYQRRLGFRQQGGLRQCQRVDAPAVLLHRALEDFTISITMRPGRECCAYQARIGPRPLASEVHDAMIFR